jgi:hypothetical protein
MNGASSVKLGEEVKRELNKERETW